MEIHHDFMRERYQGSEVNYILIPGAYNPADIFTKPLGRQELSCSESSWGWLNFLQHTGDRANGSTISSGSSTEATTVDVAVEGEEC